MEDKQNNNKQRNTAGQSTTTRETTNQAKSNAEEDKEPITIQIMINNIRGATKGDRFKYGTEQTLKTAKPDVVLVQESWLLGPKECLIDFLINSKYDHATTAEIISENNPVGIGTGLINATNTLTTKSIDTYERTPRILVTKLEYPKVDIINIYAPTRSKSQDDKDEFNEQLKQEIIEINKHEDSIIIGGDFNIESENNMLGKMLKEQFKVIETEEGTHESGSKIDYFYVTNNIKIIKKEIIINATSDHDAVMIEVEIPEMTKMEIEREYTEIKYPELTIPKTEKQIKKFRKDCANHIKGNMKRDTREFIREIENSTETKKPSKRAQKQIDKLYSIMENAIVYAASKTTKNKKKKNFKWNEECKEIYEEMEEIKAKQPRDIQKYKTVKGRLKRVIKELRIEQKAKEDEHVIEMYETNILDFYKHIKRNTRAATREPPIKEIYENYTKIYQAKTQYERIKFKKEKYEGITESETIETLEQIKTGKSSFKNIRIELWRHIDIHLITTLYNAILRNGTTPAEMLRAHTKLLIKDKLGLASDPGNWRPISLVNSLAKGLEIILLNKLNMSKTSKNQHGYKRGFSTLTCYKALTKTIKLNKILAGQCYICYLDLSKAFDTLPYKQLIDYVKEQKTSNHVKRALQTFITKSEIQIGQKKEEILSIKQGRGVKQGAISSPKLFTAVIDPYLKGRENQRDKENTITRNGYADDIAITTATATDMQESINEFVTFCKKTGLTPNIKKTKMQLHLSAEAYENMIAIPNIELEGKCIEYEEQFKYLGIQIHNTLEDKHHMEYVLRKYRKSIYMIRKVITTTNKKLRIKVLKTYLIPKMYGLETVTERIGLQYESRYNYLTSIALQINTTEIENIYEKNPEIMLKNLIKKARERYRDI